MQLRPGGFSWQSVLSLVPGIWEAPFLRDFPGQHGRGGAARHGNRRRVLSLVPGIREDPSVRDLLTGRRERRGGPSWAPGSDLILTTTEQTGGPAQYPGQALVTTIPITPTIKGIVASTR